MSSAWMMFITASLVAVWLIVFDIYLQKVMFPPKRKKKRGLVSGAQDGPQDLNSNKQETDQDANSPSSNGAAKGVALPSGKAE